MAAMIITRSPVYRRSDASINTALLYGNPVIGYDIDHVPVIFKQYNFLKIILEGYFTMPVSKLKQCELIASYHFMHNFL
jgi:hypothetical protein